MAKNKIETFNLKNKVAIITAGYSHLGSSMTRALLSFGANVFVAGRNEKKFAEVFTPSEQQQLHFATMDITDSHSIEECVHSISNKVGRVDILINNANAARGRSQENMSDEDWLYTMEGVVGSAHKTIRAVIPLMKQQASGKIINIVSMYGMVSPDFRLYEGNNCEKFTNPPHYGAGKAALIQLTKYYAVLLGRFGIQVNAISPGPFPKPEIQNENPVFIQRLTQKNPLQKLGKPHDLDGVVVLLSSNASDFITGQTIQVDGGWTIW